MTASKTDILVSHNQSLHSVNFDCAQRFEALIFMFYSNLNEIQFGEFKCFYNKPIYILKLFGESYR